MAHHEDDGVGYAYGTGEYGLTPAGSGHEHTDANVWIIVKFGVWLLVAAVLVHVGMWVMFELFVERTEETTQTYPLAAGQERRLPAEPRLQSIPVNDIYRFRLQEDDVLQNYRWIDRTGGRVQIPIGDAMRLTVERGLPSRSQPVETQAAGTPSTATQPIATPPAEDPGTMPADSSAGRTVERRRQ